jgi:hypothetical protein
MDEAAASMPPLTAAPVPADNKNDQLVVFEPRMGRPSVCRARYETAFR